MSTNLAENDENKQTLSSTGPFFAEIQVLGGPLESIMKNFFISFLQTCVSFWEMIMKF